MDNQCRGFPGKIPEKTAQTSSRTNRVKQIKDPDTEPKLLRDEQ